MFDRAAGGKPGPALFLPASPAYCYARRIENRTVIRMHGLVTSFGLAVALSLAAQAHAQSRELPPLPADAVVVPGCGMKDYSPRETRELLALAESTGDIGRMADAMRAQRAAVDEALVDDAVAASRFKPIIDRYFSNDMLRDRARCAFVGGMRPDLQPLWVAWIADPAMLRIHARLTAPSKIGTVASIDPERMRLLLRISSALSLNEKLRSQQREREYLIAAVKDARDPMTAAMASLRHASYPRGPGDEAIAERWLAAVLKDVDAHELNRFLAFAESEAGQSYYQKFFGSHFLQSNEWHDAFASVLASATIPVPADGTHAQADALFAEAKQRYGNGNVEDNARARLLLLRAVALKPADAQIRLLLGQVSMTTRSGRHPEVDEIRVPTDPKSLEEAETHLKEAIALDPTLPLAYLAYGRTRFLLEDDAEADRNFKLARQHGCASCPRLDLYEGDLMAIREDWQNAAIAYRAAFAHPSASDFTQRNAFAKLIIVATNAKHPEVIRAIGDPYMQQNPRDVGVGELYVSHLMNSQRDYAAALNIIDAAGNDHGHGWVQLRALALSGLARQSADARGRLSGLPAQQMREAVALVGGLDLARMHCLGGSDGATLRSIANYSEDPRQTATYVLGCAIVTRNTGAVVEMIALGADVNATTRYPHAETPLCLAYYSGSPDVFKALLDARADRSRRCSDGRELPEVMERRRREVPQIEQMYRMLDIADPGSG